MRGRRYYRIIKWTARSYATVVFVLGSLFYLGYGNPLPFIDPDYSLMENTWLTLFPLILAGLLLGWKWERIGGWLITGPLFLGFMASLMFEHEIPVPLLIPFLAGLLFLVSGYLHGSERAGHL
jgi:hypothetical protein